MNSSPWKAMFWKECSENVRWACLAGLSLSCALAYAWFHLFQQSSDHSLEQMWSSENLVLTITMPLIGLVLGLLQILPELRRDQWAFLVHRPASRTTLFFGKVLPGVCLYGLATTLTLLGMAGWAAHPGHFPAPFDFRFTLAGWSAILFGLPFYFAGLLVALRPARWYGSRALPIVGALFAPLAANGLNEFWQVASISILVTAALLAAAWGSFLTSGQYEGQSRSFRFGLGASLYVGIVIVAITLTLLCISGYQALFPSDQNRIPITQYAVDSREHVVRTTYQGGDLYHFADQNGGPMPTNYPGAGNQMLPFEHVVTPFVQVDTRERRYNMPLRYVAPLQTFLYNYEDTDWFYLYDRSQAVGYSLRTRRVVGYLGPRGFANTSASAGRFTGSLLNNSHQNNTAGLLVFERAVYRYNTETQSIKKVWSSFGNAKLDGFYVLTSYDMNKPNEAIILASSCRFYVLTGTGQPLFTIPYAVASDSIPFVTVSMTPKQNLFLFWYSVGDYDPSYSTSKIITVSSTGQVVRSIILPAFQSRPPNQSSSAVGLLVPPVADALGISMAFYYHWFGSDQERKDTNLMELASLRGLLLLSLLTGLIAAVLSWPITRRLGDNRRGQIAWALGIFWLGWYGILLLLALRAWPARVPCPNCTRLRVVDRESCEHCRAVWARPLRDGTEILDADSREVAGKES